MTEASGRAVCMRSVRGIGFDALVCELALHAKLKTFLNRIGLGKLVYLILTVKSMRALRYRMLT